ncbi:MAG: class I SAM-dependent DNA methyltransferase [Candidatus Fervidibacter sp.]|uniref:class I SAM-dependent DNA methyltransferase n=1 Tax=Candidatus Fervidibacter sp. TaxID=3100871 RepID=UPI004049F601
MAETDLKFRKLFGDELPTAEEFTLLPRYYDDLMRDVPYKMWIRYIQDLLCKLDNTFTFNRVLELACGTGTVAFEFAQRGCEVVGVDISPGMVQVALGKGRKLGLSKRVRFYVQDITELDLPNEPPFDLAVCLFDSLNYITDPNRLAQVFACTILHLRPSGYFVFDLNSEYALRENLFDQDNLGADENKTPIYYFWRSHYDESKRLCRVDMWFAVKDERGDWLRFKEVHWQRAYSIDEIRRMAESAGWEWVKVLDAYTYRPPHEKSERWYFVLRKPG